MEAGDTMDVQISAIEKQMPGVKNPHKESHNARPTGSLEGLDLL